MEEITQLGQDLARYIKEFLEMNTNVFSNERDFQMHLAIALADVYGSDNVDVEYYVPGKVFHKKQYCWKQKNKPEENQDMRVDLVVRKGDEYIPIELKYKTKAEITKTAERFGQSIQNTKITKDQSAQDLGRYDFWRDVRRLELLSKKFDNVKNGIAVFLTNDTAYTQKPKEKNKGKVPNCNHFYLTENKWKSRKWENDAEEKYKPERPNFSLYRTYDVKWSDTVKSKVFCFAIVIVPKIK